MRRRLLAALLPLLLLAQGAGGQSLPSMPTPNSDFAVAPCDSLGTLSATQKAGLQDRGFVKCVVPYGVVVTGTAGYPDAYLLTAANAVAEILDADKDGVPDDATVVQQLSEGASGPPAMTGGVTGQEESRGDSLEQAGFVYAFSLQTWKGPNAEVNKLIVAEEVFHMITQMGYARAYPDVFGDESWTSTMCAEMARASCVTWHHPENVCPNVGTNTRPPLQGTCNDPGCDCVEWFHQVAMILSGNTPGWYSDLIPRTKDGLRGALSADFLAVMDDPRYHQLKKPLTFEYVVGGSPTPAPGPDDASTDKTATPPEKVQKTGHVVKGEMTLAGVTKVAFDAAKFSAGMAAAFEVEADLIQVLGVTEGAGLKVDFQLSASSAEDAKGIEESVKTKASEEIATALKGAGLPVTTIAIANLAATDLDATTTPTTSTNTPDTTTAATTIVSGAVGPWAAGLACTVAMAAL